MGSTQQDVPWDRALPADRSVAICHIAKTSQPLERLICGGAIEGKPEIDLDCVADGNGNTVSSCRIKFPSLHSIHCGIVESISELPGDLTHVGYIAVPINDNPQVHRPLKPIALSLAGIRRLGTRNRCGGHDV